MSTSTALKTSPSLNVPAAADAPVVKAPPRLGHEEDSKNKVLCDSKLDAQALPLLCAG